MSKQTDLINIPDAITVDGSGIVNLDSTFSSGTTGGIIRLKDGGTQFGDLNEDSGNFLISSAQVDKDIIFKGNDGGSIITAMTIDMSAGGNVGIGNTAPAERLVIGNTSDTNPRLQFLSSTSGGNTIHFGDGTSSDSYRGYIHYNHANDSLAVATSGSESLRIDASGRVTTPNQPSFSAWHNTGATITSAGGIIVWNSTHCNIGGHYSNSNGRFTAPVAGRYLFSWTTLNRRPTAQIASLYKNGSNIWNQGPLLVTPSASGNHEATVGSSVIISMSASDYVDVRAYHVNSGDIYYGQGHANFMGYLLG